MEIRRVIYTTNAIESLNRSLRKAIKTKAVFPDEESVLQLLYLAMKILPSAGLDQLKIGRQRSLILLFFFPKVLFHKISTLTQNLKHSRFHESFTY
jgi:hypothetical protein